MMRVFWWIWDIFSPHTRFPPEEEVPYAPASTVDLYKTVQMVPVETEGGKALLAADNLEGDPCGNCGHVHLHEADIWVEVAPGICVLEDQAPTLESPVAVPWKDCGKCYECLSEVYDDNNMLPVAMTRMIVCVTCGNKRCPHATFHGNACTDSNEPGQPGSRY